MTRVLEQPKVWIIGGQDDTSQHGRVADSAVSGPAPFGRFRRKPPPNLAPPGESVASRRESVGTGRVSLARRPFCPCPPCRAATESTPDSGLIRAVEGEGLTRDRETSLW